MVIVENGVNYNIKRYNDLKVLNERLTKTLKSKLDELDNQKKSYEQLYAMKNVSQTSHIRDALLYIKSFIIRFFQLPLSLSGGD